MKRRFLFCSSHIFLCMKLQMTFAILILSVCVIDVKDIDKVPVI